MSRLKKIADIEKENINFMGDFVPVSGGDAAALESVGQAFVGLAKKLKKAKVTEQTQYEIDEMISELERKADDLTDIINTL